MPFLNSSGDILGWNLSNDTTHKPHGPSSRDPCSQSLVRVFGNGSKQLQHASVVVHSNLVHPRRQFLGLFHGIKTYAGGGCTCHHLLPRRMQMSRRSQIRWQWDLGKLDLSKRTGINVSTRKSLDCQGSSSKPPPQLEPGRRVAARIKGSQHCEAQCSRQVVHSRRVHSPLATRKVHSPDQERNCPHCTGAEFLFIAVLVPEPKAMAPCCVTHQSCRANPMIHELGIDIRVVELEGPRTNVKHDGSGMRWHMNQRHSQPAARLRQSSVDKVCNVPCPRR